MATSTGLGGGFGIGKESTYGTAVARAVWLYASSLGLKRTIEFGERDNLASGGGVRRHKRYISADNVGGAINGGLTYENHGMVLEACFNNAVSTTGAGPYVHTYTLGTTELSHTIEQIRGDSTNSEVFEGCTVESWELSISSGGQTMLSTTWIGETSAARAAKGTFTAGNGDEPVYHDDYSTLSWNSNTLDLYELRIRVTNSKVRRQPLGSTTTKQPGISGFREIEVEFTVQHLDNDTPYANFLAEIEADATITATGSGNNVCAITIQNMEITDVSDPIDSAGIILQRITARVRSDGTDHGLKFVMTNDTVSGIGAGPP